MTPNTAGAAMTLATSLQLSRNAIAALDRRDYADADQIAIASLSTLVNDPALGPVALAVETALLALGRSEVAWERNGGPRTRALDVAQWALAIAAAAAELPTVTLGIMLTCYLNEAVCSLGVARLGSVEYRVAGMMLELLQDLQRALAPYQGATVAHKGIA